MTCPNQDFVRSTYTIPPYVASFAIADLPTAPQPSHPVSVPVASLTPGDSPRLAGQSKEHVARLAEIDDPLPPILVDPTTMRVIDGAHRLMAAILRGSETIEVEFFEGRSADAFLHGVLANITHGYPLSRADRRAAAKRILVSHPHLSDRAIAQIAGLGAKTVATLRERAGDQRPVEARTGRDGRTRPLNGAPGRLRAAELIVQRPHASLRELARVAGVSPATVSDVRKRLDAGLEPVAARHTPGSRVALPVRRAAEPAEPAVMTLNNVASLLSKLSRDPSLRQQEAGRRLLILLQSCTSGARNLTDLVETVPPHCTTHIGLLARQVAQMWLDFAKELSTPEVT
jgi:ParB-like chromosome segregation protein Spo0J